MKIVDIMTMERKDIIDRERKEFNFLKNYLNQKQKSKSKPKIKNPISPKTKFMINSGNNNKHQALIDKNKNIN